MTYNANSKNKLKTNNIAYNSLHFKIKKLFQQHLKLLNNNKKKTNKRIAKRFFQQLP